ncbi:Cell wall-associated hydrolase, NlpC family [Geodermatophilus telluris]|uniref:Cell wall-associated hydrolase, NlpC family n=1 Tax=Geodermatophilus telluris TaxID=1190417 RepID=A0A1G6NLL8_9ACTN|nr:C40 family peptidase [Geodermatophilus telluris]SDC68862.1 Cell wall-associated hydrolase, NlpC family [Geodermatophilus telluris]
MGTRGRTRHRQGRPAARAAGTVLAALMVLGLAPGVASAAPGDDEIAAAQATRDAAAAQVGVLSAQLAEAEAAAATAHQDAQIALQDYEETQAAADAARAAADAAAAAATRAEADLGTGRSQVAAFARDSYVQGSTAPGAVALLSSAGPAQLVERAALLEAAGTHRVDVVAELTVLQAQAATAHDEADAASARAGSLEAEAAASLAGAQAQEIRAREQTAALAEQRDAVAAQAAAAEQQVAGLQQEQAAAEAAAQIAAQAAAEAAAARPVPSAPAPAAAPAPAPAPAPPATPSPGGSATPSPAPSTPQSDPTPPSVTTAGAPTASAVETAIDAALSQRGLPYSWGGGGSNGPGYGIPPDTRIWGFDCSGLTEYAYAQAGIRIGGTSRDQWWRFRDATVARADLRAGDLVFWGSGSSYTSIYHVALYLGDGTVVQAPQSGDVVRVSPMWFGRDYFGAVRPTA